MARFRVVMTEREEPLAVRRRVSFCEAVWDGMAEVEGVVARLFDNPDRVSPFYVEGEIPLLVDPDLICLQALKPEVLIDATLSKHNLGIHRDMAPLVIALGPGFSAGLDTDMVIETNRGHNLGRVITAGPAEPNTGVPGTISGKTTSRLMRAPADGEFIAHLEICTHRKVHYLPPTGLICIKNREVRG